MGRWAAVCSAIVTALALSACASSASDDCSEKGVCDPKGMGPSGPWCSNETSTLFVDGVSGSDATGKGTCDAPLRSISAALSRTRSGAGSVERIRLAGGTQESPTVYSPSSTGESLPLNLDLALVLEGQSVGGVVLTGAGAAADAAGSTSLIDVQSAVVRIQSLTVLADGCTGIAANAKDGPFQLSISDVFVKATKPATGLYLGATAVNGFPVPSTATGQGSKASFSNVSVDGGEVALDIVGVVDVTASGCTFQNASVCVREQNATNMSSEHSTFKSCGTAIQTPSKFASNNDSFSDNSVGVHARGMSVQVTVTSASFTANTKAISIDGTGATTTVRNSTFASSKEASIYVGATTATVDLGTKTDPGRNVFLPSTTGGSVCAPETLALFAVGNKWSTCPPRKTATCTGGADLGMLATPQTAVVWDVSDCSQ